MKTIDREDLRRRLRERPGRVLLVDVREREDYEAEHIKGAVSIPASELTMRAERGFARDREIILYSESLGCQASAGAARALYVMGFRNVLDYEGGLADWKAAGYLTERSGAARAA